MVDPRCIRSERKLATIRILKELKPIPDADKIELAIVDGWECVVAKKDNFVVGDKVIYIEIDSILPEKPEFEFLRPRNFRIKTIKLRKQISQGLVLPISYLGDKKYKLGDDVTDELEIKKYDPELIRECEVTIPEPKTWLGRFFMRFAWYRTLRNKKYVNSQGPFPGWIQKTNETRVQNLFSEYEEAVNLKRRFYITEKVDGQSFTSYIDQSNKVGICSRNLGVSTRGNSNYAAVFKKYNIQKVLKELKKNLKAKTIVIQGEIYGLGIQDNKYKLHDIDLLVFNFIVDGKIKPYNVMQDILVNDYHFKLVPLIEKDFLLPITIGEIVNYSKAKSVLYDRRREGVVIRSADYETSFKVINPEFLLEEE